MTTELIGALAAFFTTLAYLPQVVKVFRERDTRAISLGMYAFMCVGVALWLTYGILIMSWPVIACNGITLVLAIAVLSMKIKCG